MVRFWLAGILVAGLLTPALADEAMLAQGRESSEDFLQGNVTQLWDDMSLEMRAAFGSMDRLAAFRSDVERDFGAELEVIEEQATADQQGLDVYTRTSRWTQIEAPILMEMAFDDASTIVGFSVQPVPVLAESRFLDYQTRASLRLPFEGEWSVVWGGRTLEQNYHAADRAQRFALDLLILRDGASHAGDPANLQNYHCWGQPILAPADGKVVSVVNDLPDNPIGTTDPENPAGNHVVIDLGSNEFAFLAHMQQGTIVVAPGQSVSSGDTLGQCGNSGNTSEPHLHFHLQTTLDLATGEGLPAIFQNYVADGIRLAEGEPVSGQIVSQGAP